MISDTLTPKQQEAAIIAIEEMAELTQVLSKLIRFGYTPDKYEPLIQELGDVRCMIQLLHEHFDIDYNDTNKAIANKRQKLTKWSKLYE